MKIACISDTHGIWLPPIPDDIDVVVHAGDVGPDHGSRNWLEGPFSEWATKVGIPIYLTWGNHDFIGNAVPPVNPESDPLNLPDNVSIRVDEAATIGGVKFWFSPWSNLFGHWAFMEVESDLAARYKEIPEDTQIIVSHGPPKGFGDRIFWDSRYQQVGSESLYNRFLALPECHTLICGHIHEAAGLYHIPRHLPDIARKVVNCAQVNAAYEPVHNAVRILEV